MVQQSTPGAQVAQVVASVQVAHWGRQAMQFVPPSQKRPAEQQSAGNMQVKQPTASQVAQEGSHVMQELVPASKTLGAVQQSTPGSH